MNYVWIVCNLPAYLNMTTGRIPGPYFPSNKDVAQFHLQLIPLDDNDNKAEYITMLICLMDQWYTKRSPLQLNYTVSIRILKKYEEKRNFGPFSAVYEETICWGPRNILSYETATCDQCIAFEYHGIYSTN